ncbi:endo alpha-1,4 polygalactosaminidase [Microbacterium sp. Marseille-Q6965]|uniref:endo alpha-1,4 polygalactosaminidase n=1 Tax=Microbacterium sp. Marseille-Q6965 TaxID=2965072 RepID=UPI0021B77ACB|nr:endo alpha-1,4 polygalactosaminidase [Microbacterium sp. Marseille-Q6965]
MTGSPAAAPDAVSFPRRLRATALVAAAAALVTGCAPAGDEAAIALPPTAGTFDYQLGGTDDTLRDDSPLDVVVRDVTAEPLPGAYSVCYVNGFQTQPGAEWDETLLLREEDGTPVVDPQWPDERVLDPSTARQREGILDVIVPLLDRCAHAGFDAVEIDNLDTWARFAGIDRGGGFELASAYVDAAHARGLAIAQKNAAEAAPDARRLGFDFAVTEECAAYDECAAYTDAYGDHVLQIEYPDALAGAGLTFADVCALPDRAPLTILRDRDLVAQHVATHLYEAC